MAGSIKALVEYALDWRNIAASHIIVVPFVTAVLIYLNRERIFQTVRYSVVPGALVIVVAIAVFAGTGSFRQTLTEGDRLAASASLLVTLWLGGFLFFYGSDVFKRALFPLLFLVFFIPIPSLVLDQTIALLQRGSAEMALVIFRLTGTPVYREGFVFALPGLVIEVAPECSGIRSGIGIFILSLIAGHLLLQTWWRRAVLVLLALPIQIVKNAIRIDALSLLTIHVDKSIIEGRLHHEGGAVFFMLGLVLIYPILLMLMKSESKTLTVSPRTANL
jgi:exosortase